MVVAGKDKGPIVRINKSINLLRNWVNEHLEGYKRLDRCNRLVDRIESKFRLSFNETGGLDCKRPKVEPPPPTVDEVADDGIMVRKWPKDPYLQINKMARNFRKIANDYTKECRKHNHYLSLTRRIERTLSKGLLAVLRAPSEDSG